MICRDEEAEDGVAQAQKANEQINLVGGNPYLDVPCLQNAKEYKKGYVMRKCCYESNAKRSEYTRTTSVQFQFRFFLSQFSILLYDCL